MTVFKNCMTIRQYAFKFQPLKWENNIFAFSEVYDYSFHDRNFLSLSSKLTRILSLFLTQPILICVLYPWFLLFFSLALPIEPEINFYGLMSYFAWSISSEFCIALMFYLRQDFRDVSTAARALWCNEWYRTNKKKKKISKILTFIWEFHTIHPDHA